MVNLERMRLLISIEHRLRMKRMVKLSKATKITSSITGMPHGGGTHNQVEDGAIEMAEVDEAYAEVFTDLSAMRGELKPLIEMLDNPDDIAVMRYRYIMGIPLSDIPDLMHVSDRAMFYHLSNAERTLIKMYPETVSLH